MHGRREFLLASAAALVACGDESEKVMGVPPWHVWGNSKNFFLDVPAVGSAGPRLLQQVTAISYGRPDSWSFLFSVQVTDFVESGGVAKSLIVSFDLVVGLGLVTVTLPGFALFQVTPIAQGNTKWTTEVESPRTQDVLATSTRRISHIPAQNIQVTARVEGVIDTGFTWSCNVACNAQFAPRTHVRPEWMMGPEDGDVLEKKFRGGEHTAFF